jgi:hypothetical protein
LAIKIKKIYKKALSVKIFYDSNDFSKILVIITKDS